MVAPRRKTKTQPLTKGKTLLKQQLSDFEHQLSMDVGALLVLVSEGSQQQAAIANQKAKSNFLKFGPEMHRIAQELGGTLLEATEAYLDSIDAIVHSPKGFLDEAKITHCYKTTQKLQKELRG